MIDSTSLTGTLTQSYTPATTRIVPAILDSFMYQTSIVMVHIRLNSIPEVPYNPYSLGSEKV